MAGHQSQDNMGNHQHLGTAPPHPQCSLGFSLGKVTNTIVFLSIVIFIELISSTVTDFSPKLFQPWQNLKFVLSVPSSFPGKSLVSTLSPFVSNKRQMYSDCLFASEVLSTSQSPKRFFEKYLPPLKRGLKVRWLSRGRTPSSSNY